MPLPDLLLLANAASTLALVGLIWTVQVVHYPLFGAVGEAHWAAYHAGHGRRITWVVAPLMLVELATAVALVGLRPLAMPAWAAVAGAALVGLLWLSTVAVQVPLHNALAGGWDARAHARLVATNGVRTGLWTLRGGLMVWVLACALAGA